MHSKSTLYKIDGARIGFREYWAMARFSGAIAWLFKACGKPLPLGDGIGWPKPLASKLCQKEAHSAEVRARLEDFEREALACGLSGLEHFGLPEAAGQEGQGGGFALLLPSRDAVLQCGVVVQGSRTVALATLATRLASGRYLISSTAPRAFRPTESFLVQWLSPECPLWELLERHKNRLEEISRDGDPPERIVNSHELAELLDEVDERSFAELVARGVYVPMADDELVPKERHAEQELDAEGRERLPQDLCELSRTP